MSAGKHKQTFKLTEAARFMKAARLAGLPIKHVTLDRDGRPVLIIDQDQAADTPPEDTSWDDLKTDAQESNRSA